MINRRDFLKLGVLASAGLVLPLEFFKKTNLDSNIHGMRFKTSALASPTLKKYQDALPIPGVVKPSGTVNNMPLYEVEMTQFKQKLHKNLPATTVWGYNGTYPGPTFETRTGKPVAVHWKNNLPSNHFLPIDHGLHGAETTVPDVRSVVHLHGAKVLPDSDGHPEAWFTNGFGQTGPVFTRQTYVYPNDQQAATLWYHDHSLGITRLNVYTGLAGYYLIRDAVEDKLNLPKGDYEIPLLIQDRLFNPDGSLLYPVIDLTGETNPLVPKVWIPEFFGDTILVNGKVWPYLEVEPRKYRFRMLNGSNARFYHMTLNECTDSGISLGRPGPAFHQIGTDGGLLPAPVQLTDFLLAPAERNDIIIDFSGLAGKSFVLNNDAKAPYPDGDDVIPSDIMMFKVTKPLSGRDTSSLPAHLTPISMMSPSAAVKQRDLTLTELDSDAGNPIIGLLDNAMWSDPVIENPKAGTVEVWNIMNLTGDAHPIHVHLVQFQVLDRQALLTDAAGNPLPQVDPNAPKLAPEANERPAWKDTIKTYPGTVTRIIAKFDLPAGTKAKPGDKFHYIWHCHILDHEDNEMMRPFDVVA